MMKMMNDPLHPDHVDQDNEGIYECFHWIDERVFFSLLVDEFLLMHPVRQHRIHRQIVKVLDH